MSKFLFACAATVAAPLWVAGGSLPAQAGALAFVSSKGENRGDCSSQASPCATFKYAVSQTWAGGEVRALDAGNYGGVVINKAITISGVEGAAIFQPAGDAIKIAVGANDKVVLSNLTLSGPTRVGLVRGPGPAKGIVFIGGGSLTIENCAIRNFRSGGVDITATSPLKMRLDQVTIADNGGVGLYARAVASSTPIKGLLHGLSATGNSGMGVVFDGFGGGSLDAVDSTISHNGGAGVAVLSTDILRLAHSFVMSNSGKGVFLTVGGVSDGKNVIMGNGAGSDDNLSGHLTVSPSF
jgi:hypothetical protein